MKYSINKGILLPKKYSITKRIHLPKIVLEPILFSVVAHIAQCQLLRNDPLSLYLFQGGHSVSDHCLGAISMVHIKVQQGNLFDT